MSLKNLARASGLAGICAGLLIALIFILQRGRQEPGTAHTILTTHYSLEHTLAVACILMMLFLPRAYSLQAQRCGFLGFLGFVLAFIGSALMVGVFMHDGYALPHEATLTTWLKPVGTMNGAVIVAAIAFVGGFVVFRLATMKAGVFSRWARALPILGSIIINLPWALLDIGASLLGAGLAWVGIGSYSAISTATGE
jgi:hypothetical protein